MGSLSESSGAEDPVALWLAEADAAEREGRQAPPPPTGLEDEAEDLRMCVSMLAKVWPGQEDTPIGSTHVDRPVVDQTLLPDKLGEFEILRILGRGGFGVVCLANDPRIPRLVAIKLPRPEWMASASVQRRFRLEAKLAGGMQHAHIVPVFESGQLGSVLYLVSEYCPGPNLALWIREREKAERKIDAAGIREAATVVAQLADGLAHAHERGVLHRDLKPANILLQPIGPDVPADAPLSRFVPKLTDFGLAKLMEQGAGETRSGAAIGTPSFMAPEQAKGDLDAIDPRTDVYGLGAVLYQLLTGVPPFGSAFEVLNEELTPPSRLCKNVPADLEAICRKCLEKDQSQRYPTARALREDLE